MRVAVLGTGILGRAVAERLHASGHTVTVYNRTLSRTASLQALGISVVGSPSEALHTSECGLLLLSDAAAIRSVLLSADTRPALQERTLIQMGTIGPDESRDLAEAVHAAGGDYLEAPVLGSVTEAQTGHLLVMVGGQPSQLHRWEPLLRMLAREPLLVGAVGQAAAMKLALNQLIAAETAAFSLSLGLVQRAGVPLELFMSLLKQSAVYAPTFDKKLPRLKERRYGNPNFSTRHLLKDVDLVLTCARQHRLRTEGLDGVRRLLEQALEEGHGEVDYSAVYEVVNRPTAGET